MEKSHFTRGGGSSISNYTKVAEKSGRMTSYTFSNAVVGKYYVLICNISANSSNLKTTPFSVSGADIIGQGIAPKESYGSTSVCAGTALIKATSTSIAISQYAASYTPCYGLGIFEIS